MFKERPAFPAYSLTYNVNPILDIIKNLEQKNFWAKISNIVAPQNKFNSTRQTSQFFPYI